MGFCSISCVYEAYSRPHPTKLLTLFEKGIQSSRMGNGQTKQATLGDEVFERVLDLIYRGEIEPGSAINESALATKFGVSRGPVREAIRRLQGIQLVTREAFLKARVVSLTPEALIELFQMREALEGYACRLAANLMKDDEIAALNEELDGLRNGSTDGTSADRGFDFHERIVRASGNTRLIDALCGDLYHLCRMYRRLSGAGLGRHEQAQVEHWQIFRAIKNRDGELAESLMRSHIQRATQNIIRQTSNNGALPSSRIAAA